MNSTTRLLLAAALLLFVVAPFAGLAPLLLVLLVAGMAWIANDWLKTVRGEAPAEERRESGAE